MSKLTKEQQSEFLKCATDFPYFCETYIKINCRAFKLYPYQERLYNHIEDYRQTIFSKFRNGGFSTELGIYSLWRCLFREDQRICFATVDDKMAVHISDIVKTAAQSLPSWMSEDVKLINNHVKTFPETNGSIQFQSMKNAGSLTATNLLFIDEASFIGDMDKQWKEMAGSLSATGCRLVIYSTANLTTDWFWRTLTDALNGRNTFTVYECEIDEHPEFCDKVWQDSMKITLGNKFWVTEYEQSAVMPNKGDKVVVEKKAAKEIRSIFDEWDSSKM